MDEYIIFLIRYRYFIGNRGLLYEVWISIVKNYGIIDEIFILDSLVVDYNFIIIDEIYFFDSFNKSFVFRFSGIFIFFYNFFYRFFIKCDDYVVFYFSEIGNLVDKVSVLFLLNISKLEMNV